MIEKIHIDTLDLPELEPYRHMKWQFEQRQQGIFVAEGEKVVRRLLNHNSRSFPRSSSNGGLWNSNRCSPLALRRSTFTSPTVRCWNKSLASRFIRERLRSGARLRMPALMKFLLAINHRRKLL